MAELTKEHFDQQLKSLVTQTALETAFDKQAVLINNAFQAHSDHFDQRLDKIETKVDVIQGKLDNILYKEVVQIETRVKKIEQHLGLKAA